MTDERRVYGKLRDIIERHGGTMNYQGTGRHGAWVIMLGDKTKTIEATGEMSFPELDRLYIPKIVEPKTWEDRHDELLADAEEKLLELLTRD